jgi:NAD(P)-dependent dehydrogenase (short-subunit alcohol dehydrogenase family)
MAADLAGRVALVAGATRGAGRGIAAMLGEAGAVVYCTGRTTREHPATGAYKGRKETIEETAEMVTAKGGRGIAVRVDHLVRAEVEALVARIRKESKRLDILVNDISEATSHDWAPFWKVDLEKGFRGLANGVHTHLITAQCAAPLMMKARGGLIVEISDGDFLGYHGTLFYDLVKTNVNRLALVMAEELHKHGIAVVAISPGYMRTEMVLDHHKVSEANWREAARKDKLFGDSETPFFVGRAVAALAADPRRMEKSGGLFGSWTLAREYGFTDVDGRRPDLARQWEKVFGKPLVDAPGKTSFWWKQVRERRPARTGSNARSA